MPWRCPSCTPPTTSPRSGGPSSGRPDARRQDRDARGGRGPRRHRRGGRRVMVARGDLGVRLRPRGRAPLPEADHPSRRGLRPPGDHGHPDARVHGPRPVAHPGRGHRRRQRRVRRHQRGHAVRRDRDRPAPRRRGAPMARITPAPSATSTTRLGPRLGQQQTTGPTGRRRPPASPSAITAAAWRASVDAELAAIIACTNTGTTARVICRFRPTCPIIAVTPSLGRPAALGGLGHPPGGRGAPRDHRRHRVVRGRGRGQRRRVQARRRGGRRRGLAQRARALVGHLAPRAGPLSFRAGFAGRLRVPGRLRLRRMGPSGRDPQAVPRRAAIPAEGAEHGVELGLGLGQLRGRVAVGDDPVPGEDPGPKAPSTSAQRMLTAHVPLPAPSTHPTAPA